MSQGPFAQLEGPSDDIKRPRDADGITAPEATSSTDDGGKSPWAAPAGSTCARDARRPVGRRVTTPSAATRGRFVHEACLYESEDEVLSVIVPFIREAVEHGEAAVVDVDDHKKSLLRSELGPHADHVTFVDRPLYTNPASAIREYVRLFESLVSDGALGIRSVGELPVSAANGSWHAWRRYEAAINVAFADLPVWGICLFDRSTFRPGAVADVLCTHPHLATPGALPAANDLYTDPSDWLTQLPPPPRYDVEHTDPLVELVNPAPHDARAAVAPLAEGLSTSDQDGLLGGVSELVSNALDHGEPPVTLRAWSTPGSVVVTVDDCGAGIDDPLAGLIAPTREMGTGGLGLWITRQLCNDVAVMNLPDGFRVRLVAGSNIDDPSRQAPTR